MQTRPIYYLLSTIYFVLVRSLMIDSTHSLIFLIFLALAVPLRLLPLFALLGSALAHLHILHYDGMLQ